MPTESIFKSSGGGETVLLQFDSGVDVIDYIEKGLERRKDYNAFRDNQDRREWTGNCNFADAFQRMRYGNDRYTQDFLRLSSANGSGEVESKAHIRMDVDGVAYDMGAVVSGEPECCVNMETAGVKPVVRLLIDITFDCGVGAKTITRRGVALSNLINTLICMGFVVEANVVYIHDNRNLGSNRNIYQLFRINTNSQCISEIAFYMAPEFMRILNFLITEIYANDASIGGHASGYISKSFVNEIEKNGTLFLGGSYNDNEVRRLDSQEDANAYIEKRFKEFCERNNIQTGE